MVANIVGVSLPNTQNSTYELPYIARGWIQSLNEKEKNKSIERKVNWIKHCFCSKPLIGMRVSHINQLSALTAFNVLLYFCALQFAYFSLFIDLFVGIFYILFLSVFIWLPFLSTVLATRLSLVCINVALNVGPKRNAASKIVKWYLSSDRLNLRVHFLFIFLSFLSASKYRLNSLPCSHARLCSYTLFVCWADRQFVKKALIKRW